MRHNLLLSIATLAVAVLSSCGSSRNALESQNLLMQQQILLLQQQQQAQAQAQAEAQAAAVQQQQAVVQQQQAVVQPRPERTARELDPCEELAVAESKYYRSSGTAVAHSESEAKSAALADARNQLAQMVRVVVNGASQDYTRSTATNTSISTSSVSEELMNQYVYQSLESTKPLLWSVYDLSDGTIQVYVCVEMTKDPDEFSNEFQSSMAGYMGGNASYITALPRVNPESITLFEQGKLLCLKNDYTRGVPVILKAVDMGNMDAQYFVGLMYLYGDHVEQNSKIAFQYILSAANGSHKQAVFEIAEMYNSGTGISKDKDQARFWYRRAKELGDTRAESRLRRL